MIQQMLMPCGSIIDAAAWFVADPSAADRLRRHHVAQCEDCRSAGQRQEQMR